MSILYARYCFWFLLFDYVPLLTSIWNWPSRFSGNESDFLLVVFLKRFLIAWTHHIGSVWTHHISSVWTHHISSVWFEELTEQLINEITDVILQRCKFIQIRLVKIWGSIISIYVMVGLYVIFKLYILR